MACGLASLIFAEHMPNDGSVSKDGDRTGFQMSLADRRSKYQRSQTLSSIQMNKTQPKPPPQSSDLSTSLEKISKNIPSVTCSTTRCDPKVDAQSSTSAAKSSEVRPQTETHCRFSNESIKLPQKWINSSHNQSTKVRPKSLTRKISYNEFHQSSSLISCAKSSNGSINIFNRVKDKIVETVYHTQDMPHWAAIVQEKRQKAADEYEAKIVDTLNRELSNENSQKSNKLLVPTVHTETPSQRDNIIAKREKARQGFRRRSISQDSYPQNLLLPKAGPLVAKKSNEGITCSSGDFQAILQEFNNYLKESKGASKNSSIASNSSKHEDQIPCTVKTPSENAAYLLGESAASQKIKTSSERTSSSFLHNEFSLARIAETDCTARNSFDAVEVEYDENGQTWGVYGAEIDPEILGNAIQLHLQRLIDQKMNRSSESEKLSDKPGRKYVKRREIKQLKNSERQCFVSKFFCFIKRKSCDVNTVEE